MSMIHQVLATVGGSGTRLYPLTLSQPKPLVEICDTALLAILFRQLANQGCREFILGSKGSDNTLKLSNYFKTGEGFFKRLDLNIADGFSYQPQYNDIGSADAVRYCFDYFNIKQDILVAAGDNLIDIDLSELFRFHHQHESILTVVVKELQANENLSHYGVADIDCNWRIKKFVEKPKAGTEPSRMINTAFYIFSPRIRKIFCTIDRRFTDIGKDLIPYLVENGHGVFAFPITGYWIGIGTPERLHQATMDALAGKIKQLPIAIEYRPHQWIHPSTLSKIKRYLNSGDIELKGNVSIGRDCLIERGTLIEDSHIGYSSTVEKNTEIRKSLVMSFNIIQRGARLNRTIVGRHSIIGKQSILDADTPPGNGKIPVIGEDVVLPDESIVSSGTRVAPLRYVHKIMDTGKFQEFGIDDRNIYFAERIQ